MAEELDKKFVRRAIGLAQKAIDINAGGPFGAVIVRDGEVISEGWNQVTSTNDPTAHAEIVAIRKACKKLGSFQLEDCVLYSSCEPCPMCLGSIYWARPKKLVFASTKEDAATFGFDDEFIYDEILKKNHDRNIETISILREESLEIFKNWQEKSDKIEY